MTSTQPIDPTVAFARLARIKLGETDPAAILQTITGLARQTIPGIDGVSVTLLHPQQARTAAFTGEAALHLDEEQYRHGHGPCLEASASGGTVIVPDMSADSRWPAWSRQATKLGMNSSLSIGLPVRETVLGALNLYATGLEAGDDDTVILARTFAGYAAVALANAGLFDATAALARQLQAATDSRAVIEQAKGIVMGDRRCTADEAFRFLSEVSQDSDRKLRDVATALVQEAARREP
jgi:GAF domain-containing protein